MQAGYTYLDGEITKIYGRRTRDSVNPWSATTSAACPEPGAFGIWTTYNLSESIISGSGKWTVGGGILWQSEMFSGEQQRQISTRSGSVQPRCHDLL